MPAIPPAIEVYPGHHLPIIKAYADQLGLVGRIKHDMPTARAVDAGTVVLGLVLDPRRGRSPLSRVEALMAHHDTELLLGQALPAHAFHDETVGRVLERLYDRGTMQLVTAWAVRAVTRFGWERRYVHFATTSRRVWGAYPLAEAQDVPCSVRSGSSKEKRPALQPCVRSRLCVDRAGPSWGQPEEGNASEKTLTTTLVSASAQLRARPGGQPGASSAMAAAALVTEDHRAALGASLCIPRFPAPDSACERVIAEAVAHQRWAEVGVLAQTPPTTPRPKTVYQVAAGRVP